MTMNILMAHNYYREAGGEDQSFLAEKEILSKHGHIVLEYIRRNNLIKENGLISKLSLASTTVWAHDTFREYQMLTRQNKIDVAHFQNTFPLISPSAFYACQQASIPVVQSVRNYRLVCPNAFFFRDQKVCEDCLDKFYPWPGIIHKCYRQSALQTVAVANMLFVHRLLKTWQKQVNIFIALSEFSKNKLIEGGLPADKIVVKPNFVEDCHCVSDRYDQVVVVGRLSSEKGILKLIKAWRKIRNIPLVVVGTGPLQDEVAREIKDLSTVRLLGALPHHETLEVIKHSKILIFPTELYETFGRVIIEAYAAGVPVVASRIGAVSELVMDGITGFLVSSQNPDEFAQKVEWLWNHPHERLEMGKNARLLYEKKYTPERNYELLMEIYNRAILHAHR
jgi:glycosyltransferase involved in cell wall biosynthesis